jgi:glutamate carboxypeptidase
MLEMLRRLVEAESPSADVDALARCAAALAAAGRDLLGIDPETIHTADRVHLRWRLGTRPRVAVIGHFDTVWPLGTLAARPFSVNGGRATGPGVFDMKAGLVQGLFAVAAVARRGDVELLFTSDEEIGSATSRGLIEELAQRVDAALVLEPAHDGALKVGRKGVSMYSVEVHGVAAHAGLEPERGVNALAELARVVLAVESFADPARGTTVTPTMARAGVADNVVPPSASLHLDVRARTVDEQRRVDKAMHALRASIDGATVQVDGGPNRPPLEEQRSRDLFERAAEIAAQIGLGALRGVTVGGGSDGNLTAAVGTPTLDGLGAVGAGAHADHEYVEVAEMVPRAALLALLIDDLCTTNP